MKKINKIGIALAAASFAAVSFSGCSWLFDESSGSDDIATTTATEEKTWDFTSSASATQEDTWNYSSSSSKVFKVDSSTLSVNINGDIGGKTLYLVQVNPSENKFPGNYLRYVKSSETLSSSLSDEVVESESSRSVVSETDFDESVLGRKHFVGEKLPEFNAVSSRSAISEPSLSVTQITRSVGTTKNIYVDTDTSMSTYEQKSATLRAVGTYCNVWVVDDYYSSSASGNKVDSTVAQKYADAFDKMYKVITNVFGDESNKILDYDSSTLKDISSLSDTGEYVNIVIYDIAADYKNKDNVSSVGVVGYFYAKDYYYTAQGNSVSLMLSGNSVITKSNVGKYFYIDSGYANTNLNDTVSTLAHEFQHMINFNKKNILQNLSPDTSYNEMLSMLCEDMMQDFLGLEDKESPKNRTQGFNIYYYLSGIREYRTESSYSALSYATSYIFGSWLCRQYGGAKLVKEIMDNSYVDSASLVAAVNSVNGTSYTFDDLFRQFLLALLNDSTYTHNKDASQTLTYSSGNTTYSYPMTAFNIFGSDYSPSALDGFSRSDYPSYAWSSYKNGGYLGPFLYKNSVRAELRPEYGIMLHGVGTYSSGTTSDTITFTDTGAADLVMYLIIK